MAKHTPLTPERARELADRLEAARKESEIIRLYLEEHRARARDFWPDRRVASRALPPLPQREKTMAMMQRDEHLKSDASR